MIFHPKSIKKMKWWVVEMQENAIGSFPIFYQRVALRAPLINMPYGHSQRRRRWWHGGEHLVKIRLLRLLECHRRLSKALNGLLRSIDHNSLPYYPLIYRAIAPLLYFFGEQNLSVFCRGRVAAASLNGQWTQLPTFNKSFRVRPLSFEPFIFSPQR